MKTFQFPIAVIVCSLAVAMTACQTPEQKLEKAEKEYYESQEELGEARAEYEQFKKDSDERIAANDAMIADMRADLADMNADARARREGMIDELEKRNAVLRDRLANFRDNSESAWAAFKLEVNRDADKLEQALRDMRDDR